MTQAAVPDVFREDFEPPHPLRAPALLIALVALPAGLWVAGALPAAAATGVGAAIVFLALVLGVLGAFDLHRNRRLADALIRPAAAPQPVSALAAWRSAELTSHRSRRELRQLLRRLARQAESCIRHGGPPVDEAALAETVRLLGLLEQRLQASSRPVSPAGMLDLYALAAADVGPFDAPARAGELPSGLARALAGLDPA